MKSWERSTGVSEYLVKRVLRIYPGFIAAFLVSLFVVAPLAHATIFPLRLVSVAEYLAQLLLLQVPGVANPFPGLPLPNVNASLWTIAYEFRCYLLVIIIGIVAFRKKRPAYLLLTILIYFGWITRARPPWPSGIWNEAVFGELRSTYRFAAIFLTGIIYCLYYKDIRWSAILAALAGILAFVCMFDGTIAEPIFALMGGYVLFWFGIKMDNSFLRHLRSYPDISYGTYLYGWPIQILLLWYFRSISPWLLFICSVIISATLGLLSWRLIESRCLRLKNNLITSLALSCAPKVSRRL